MRRESRGSGAGLLAHGVLFAGLGFATFLLLSFADQSLLSNGPWGRWVVGGFLVGLAVGALRSG